MTVAIRIEALPARLGDCLLVACLREGERPWRMLVDGGPSDTWPTLEARLRQFERFDTIDVAVVTHIDSDHIGGMIPFLHSEFASRVGDYWFNGRGHLPDLPGMRSITQGESMVAALTGDVTRRVLPWNQAFDGGPIETPEDGGFVEVPVDGGPRITLISPTTKRLLFLAAKWNEAMERSLRGDAEKAPPEPLAALGDLHAVASEVTPKDKSVANGSSIGLLIEHRGASVVLAGDAFGNVLAGGLRGVARARGLDSLPVDVFKLPHHGSKANVTEAMLRTAPARNYVVSSNGDGFNHPDDVALARVVLAAPDSARLWFNYRNDRTMRWAQPQLCSEYHYTVQFPENPLHGAVLEVPVKS